MSEANVEASKRWRLDGRLALVTGATLGIGLAVAEEFLRLGATVLAVARDAKRMDERLESWRRRGARAHGIVADVSLEEGRGAVLRRLEEFGTGLDVLVNNVGTNVRRPPWNTRPKSTSASSRPTSPPPSN